MTDKVCSKCGESKSLDCFYPDRRCSFGKKGTCKTCTLARTKERLRSHPKPGRTKTCPRCGTAFYYPRYAGKIRYCSLECAFWSRVNKGTEDECWLWTAGLEKDGYGQLVFGNTQFDPHRVSLEMKLGRALLPGMFAMHECDNPPCCNPSHLREGTPLDNVQDCIAKGRAAWQKRDRLGSGSAPDVGVSSR